MAFNPVANVLTEVLGALNVQQTSTPSVLPAAGYDLLYFKSDDNLYKLTTGGIETQISGNLAPRDLSNLTSPTAINQSLLFGADNTLNIGAIAASRPANLYVATSINIGIPDASAAFIVTSTTKGIAFPRMTTVQRDAIASPVASLTVYNTDNNQLETWNGTAWIDDTETDFIKQDGSNSPTADINWNNHAISGLNGLLFFADGAGSIGASGANRPDALFTKSKILNGPVAIDHGPGWISSAFNASIFTFMGADGAGMQIGWQDSGGPRYFQFSAGGNTLNYVTPSGNAFSSDDAGVFTIQSDLKMAVDGVGNIGASGANRPNNLFLANNASVGGNLLLTGYSQFGQITTPSSPTANHNSLYFKSDDNLYILNSVGAEVQVSNPSGNANRYLSNLSSPTAINVNLLPAIDAAISLGDATHRYTSASLSDFISVGGAGAIAVSFPGFSGFGQSITYTMQIGSNTYGGYGDFGAIGFINGVTGHSIGFFTGSFASYVQGADDLTISANDGTNYNPIVKFQANQSVVMMATSSANILWNTDGGGSIGSDQANRPNHVFTRQTFVVGNKFTFDPLSSESQVIVGAGTLTVLPNLVFHTPGDTGFSQIIKKSIGTLDIRFGNGTSAISFSNTDIIIGSPNLIWNTDGGGSIGASGANRPDNIYVATKIVIGGSGVGEQGLLEIGAGTAGAKINFGINGNFGVLQVGGGFSTFYVTGNPVWNSDGGSFQIAKSIAGFNTDFSTQYFGYNQSNSFARARQSAFGSVSLWAPSTGGTLYVVQRPQFQYSSSHGGNPTTNINASTTLVLSPGGLFTSDIAIGDQVSVSSNPAIWANVVAVVDNDTLTLDAPLGDGTSQTLHVRYSIFRLEDNSNSLKMLIGPTGTLDALPNLTTDLLWDIDGGGNIGVSGVNRPDQGFFKTAITIGNITPFTLSEGSGTGIDNIVIGGGAAGSSLGIYTDNVIVGSLAAVSTADNYNTIVGSKAGQFDSHSAGNGPLTLFGYGSGQNNSGGGNTGFGYLTLQNVSGNYNLALGYHAGYGTISGDQNIYIGGNSGNNLSVTGNDNIVLAGLNGQNSDGGVSNEFILGSVDSPIYTMYLGSGYSTSTIHTLLMGASNAQGTDTSAAVGTFIIAGAQGTGTGAGGAIAFKVAPAGSSGSTLNSLVTALSVNADSTFTFTSPLGTIGTFNSTATNGGVTFWQKSGSSIGYAGSAYATSTGFANTDMAYTAINNVYLASNNGSGAHALEITSAGDMLFLSGGSTQFKVTSAGLLTTVGTAGIGGQSLSVGSMSPDNTSAIRIYSNALVGTTQIGITNTLVGSSSGTAALIGFDAGLSTAAASYTVNHAYAFYAPPINIGAGSSITTNIAFIGSASYPATNNAMFADNAAFSGNWFINQSSSYPSTFGGNVTILGTLTASSIVGAIDIDTVGTAVNYTALVTDTYVGVTDTSAARTITIPLASSVIDGHIYYVKDESGGAGTNNITVLMSGSDTVDGVTSVLITVPYGIVALIKRAGEYWTL